MGVTWTALALVASLATQTSFEAEVTQGSVKVPLPVIVVEQVVTDGHTSPIVSEPVPLTVTLPEDGGLMDCTALTESWSLPRQIELGVMPALENVPVPPDSVSASEMLVGGQSIPTRSPGVPATVTLPPLTAFTSTAFTFS